MRQQVATYRLLLWRAVRWRRAGRSETPAQLQEKHHVSSVKEALLDLASQLPGECSWDDVMYQVYVRQKIEAGLSDADDGRVVPHEDVFKEFER